MVETIKEFLKWSKLDSDIKEYAYNMQYLRNLDTPSVNNVKNGVNSICSIAEELSLHSDMLCKSYRAKRLTAEAGLQLIELTKIKNESSTTVHNE